MTRFGNDEWIYFQLGDDGGPGRELKADCGREDITFSGTL